MLKRFILSTTVVATLGLTSFGAQAQAPNLIGNFGDWAAYTFEENGSKVCYMVTQPKKAEGNYTKRGDIFALVTHRPGENTKNVFSYITGYTYKKDSDVTVTIDGKNHKLFTQKDMAWTPSQEDDNKLAEDIRQGSKMVVKGTSSRGTLTTDTISLKGSGAAHDAINKACGV
jgi:hypothetical protein